MSAAARFFPTSNAGDWFKEEGSTYRMVPDQIRQLPRTLWHAATEAWACIMRFAARGELDERATDHAMAEESQWSESFLQKGFHALDAGMKAIELKPLIVRERIHGRRQIHPGAGLKGKPPKAKDAGDAKVIADPPPAPPPEDKTDTSTDGPSSSPPRTIDPADPLIKRGLALVPDATADRIAAAVVVYTAEWVAIALDQVERRNRKPGNQPVRKWWFVLRMLENWKTKDGGPPRPAEAPTSPATSRPTPTAAAPAPLTAEELAELLRQCEGPDRTVRKIAQATLRRAHADGEIPPELVPTIRADLIEPKPRE